MSELIINNFDKLDKSIQEEIQDLISGYSSDFEIIENIEFYYWNRIDKEIDSITEEVEINFERVEND